MSVAKAFEKRLALVTGASSGIGQAVSRKLLLGGGSVLATARNEAALRSLGEFAGSPEQLTVMAGDICEDDMPQRLLSACYQRGQREADLVVVNAGRGLTGSILQSDETAWRELLELNVTASLRLMRETAKRMLSEIENEGRGLRPRDIVVIGSCVGRHIAPRSGIYSISKFAVNTAAESLRREVCDQGIRVTLVEPGLVKTKFHTNAGYGSDFYDGVDERMGPLIEASDVADAICYAMALPWHVHLHDLAIRPVRQNYP